MGPFRARTAPGAGAAGRRGWSWLVAGGLPQHQLGLGEGAAGRQVRVVRVPVRRLNPRSGGVGAGGSVTRVAMVLTVDDVAADLGLERLQLRLGADDDPAGARQVVTAPR